MKANHGQPLHVLRLHYSVYNGSGRELSQVAAHVRVKSEWPPCSSWGGPEGSFPGTVRSVDAAVEPIAVDEAGVPSVTEPAIAAIVATGCTETTRPGTVAPARAESFLPIALQTAPVPVALPTDKPAAAGRGRRARPRRQQGPPDG